MKKTRLLSYSSLKEFAISPNHFIAYKKREFSPTPPMIKGTAIHQLLLEPNEFKENFAIFGGEAKRGKVWSDFKLENEDKEILKVSEFKEITEIVASVSKQHSELLDKVVESEKHVKWTQNGLKFHGFVDAYGDGFIMDIKTCADASPKAFLRDFVKHKYYWQAPMYLESNLQSSYAGKNPEFYILAIETSIPFNSQLYRVTPEFLKKGLIEVNQAIEDFKQWDGQPGGYEYHDMLAEDGVMDLNLPSWL